MPHGGCATWRFGAGGGGGVFQGCVWYNITRETYKLTILWHTIKSPASQYILVYGLVYLIWFDLVLRVFLSVAVHLVASKRWHKLISGT